MEVVRVCGPECALLPWAPDLLPADLSSGFQWHFPSPLCTDIFPRVAVHGSTGGISFHLPGVSPSLCLPRLSHPLSTLDPHNFGFAETSDFVHFKNLGHFNEGVMKTTNYTSPKHGAVIHLTKEEADNLEEYWKTHQRKYDRETFLRQQGQHTRK